MCGGEKTREKKKRKGKETYGQKESKKNKKNKKSQLNVIIILQFLFKISKCITASIVLFLLIKWHVK